MIKNIIFDMGNVLLRFDPDSFLDRYKVEGPDRTLLKNKVFRSVEWVMLDRGTLTEETAEQRILRDCRNGCIRSHISSSQNGMSRLSP